MAKDAKTIREELARPFAPEDLEWRIQVTSKDKTSGLAIPYVTNRAIQDRLDEVVGPENWYNDYKPWHGNGKKDAQICGISIYFEDKGFITKWDGAEDSDIEPIKGGLSDSMKRSAVQWGIGRVLYKMTKPVWVKIEQKGNSNKVFQGLSVGDQHVGIIVRRIFVLQVFQQVAVLHVQLVISGAETIVVVRQTQQISRQVGDAARCLIDWQHIASGTEMKVALRYIGERIAEHFCAAF